MNQDLSSELQEIAAQFQPEKVVNNPESLSFQKHTPSFNSSFQLQSVVEQQSIEPAQQIEINISQQTDTYLNISFQDIIQLIFNNQCPQLNQALKTVIFRSYILVQVFTILNLIFIVNEVVALYFSVITKDNIKELFSVYFGFNLMSDCLVTYINFQLRYIINEAEQINQGDISHTIIEYLKHTIKVNSPFEDIVEDDEQITQAQYVALSISDKITTSKWLSYLIESQNPQIFALNRVSLLAKVILFAWGNITILQWAFINWNQSTVSQLESVLILLTLFSMIIGYLIILALLAVILVICAGIPVIIGLVIWQSCQWITQLYDEYKIHRIEQQRQRFLQNLKSNKFHELKAQDANLHEECSICLQTYTYDDDCVKLPCNVEGINHIFHDACIRVWIETCGSCPICRTVFVERIEY